ncbi:MAG: hypothetical protein QUV05_15105 [Phycisphaerae bacterium]|nr:hypothetical protein [Phycisphaerae bacterium]
MKAFFASQEETGRTKTIVQIVAACVLFAAAAFYVLRRSSEDDQLDTPESAVTYICWHDNHTFKLTPAQWDTLLKQGDVQPVSKGGAPAATSGREQRGGGGGPIRAVKCPQCGKFSCVLALDCPDGTQVPSITAKGQVGECPNSAGGR